MLIGVSYSGECRPRNRETGKGMTFVFYNTEERGLDVASSQNLEFATIAMRTVSIISKGSSFAHHLRRVCGRACRP
jgi:hypothetical protein